MQNRSSITPAAPFHSISLFDLDHTLLTINSSFSFVKLLKRRQFWDVPPYFYSLYYYLRFRWFGLPLYNLHYHAFEKVFKGRLLQDIETLILPFMSSILPQLFHTPVLKRWHEAQLKNHYTAILSSSPEFIVEPIASYLGATAYFATTYGSDFKGEINRIEQIVDGEYKAKIALQLMEKYGVDKSSLFTYSDSVLDLSFLEMSGYPVAVNPDSNLKKICLERGWEII